MTWLEILQQMSDSEYKTAKEIGVAAATLGAIVRRGYIEKTNTTPAKYRKTNKAQYYIKAFIFIKKNPSESYSFYKENEPFGMLCSVSKNDILDCWGNVWDLEGLTGIIEYPDGKPIRVPLI